MAEVKSVLPSVINDGTAISVDELNKVLASLKQQRDIIKNEYNTNIRSIIEDSRSCISVSGSNSVLSSASSLLYSSTISIKLYADKLIILYNSINSKSSE